jgi:hypothetical protein
MKYLNSFGVYLFSAGSIASIEAINATVWLDHTKVFLQCLVAIATLIYIMNKVILQWRRNRNERKNDKYFEKLKKDKNAKSNNTK